MEIKNQLKSNVGLIVLSISIIVGCLILNNNHKYYIDHQTYGMNENKIKLSGELGGKQIPLAINTNSNDVTYNSELNIAEGQKLVVLLSNGTLEKIEGKNINAKYFHISKLLTVEYSVDGKKSIKYYNAPIKWENEN